ncbi:Calx-beta domain-containing protein [Actinoplanes sp. CA-051413]|uniref:Calx-beta domain-containing protein n=1 Tax=Actinoplanes sp. CA-051413 TaxID=3239899 RepID=UPI003D996EFB
MRYSPAHAAKSGSVPFMLRGPKSLRTAMTAAVAGVVGLVPTILIASPASAATNGVTVTAPSAVKEGQDAVFTVQRDAGPGTGLVTYTLSTQNGSAIAGSNGDYIANPQPATVSLAPGASATVVVKTRVDGDLAEADETFDLTATSQSVAPVGSDYDTATIEDAGEEPTYRLTSVSPFDETAGTKPSGVAPNIVMVQDNKKVRITATLSNPAGSTIDIPVETADGTAVDEVANPDHPDYKSLPGGAKITIPQNQTSGYIDVEVVDDKRNEDALQDFKVQVSGAVTGAIPLNTTAGETTINIKDDDAAPSVSLGGAGQVAEGSPLGFPLLLTAASEKEITVNVSTSDGPATAQAASATAGKDYTPLAGTTVTFPADSVSQTALVDTIDDNDVESSPEALTATISSPVNAALGTPTSASGAISDNEAAPQVSLSVNQVSPEGNTSTKKTEIELTLDKASTIPVIVDWTLGGGTATAGVDYKSASGSITIPAGATSLTIPAGSTVGKIVVETIGDTIYEPGDEIVNINFSSPNMSVNTSSLGPQPFTIVDDDTQPSFTVGNATFDEGDVTNKVKFPVTLSGVTNGDVDLVATLTPVTADPTAGAIGSRDYDVPTAAVTIPAGSTTGYVEITLNGDKVYEGDETATLSLTRAPGETLVAAGAAPGGSHSATLTIKDNDPVPTLKFNGGSGTEGTTLKVSATPVGTAQADIPLTLTLGSSGEDAAETADYDENVLATYTLLAGTTSEIPLGTLDLNNDSIDEPVETIELTATETVPSAIGYKTNVGNYRINDDAGDLPPAVSVSSESIKEGEGSVDLDISLTFDEDTTSTEQTISVPWWTVDGSAKAGSDYTKSGGTATITPTHDSTTINVPIINDKTKESDEDFEVMLGKAGPAGVVVKQGTGSVTIMDDNDTVTPVATTLAASTTVRVGPGTVTLSGSATPGSTVVPMAQTLGSTAGLQPYGESFEVGASGKFSFAGSLTSRGTQFAVEVDGVRSKSVTVYLKETPVIGGSSPRKGAATLTVTGNPKVRGLSVRLERRNANGTWTTVGTGILNANGQYSRTVTGLRSKSAYTFRALVGSNANFGILSNWTGTKRIVSK